MQKAINARYARKGGVGVVRTEQFYKMISPLTAHKLVARRPYWVLQEISSTTYKRDLNYLCGCQKATIVWVRSLIRYCLACDDQSVNSFEFPGLWFNASEGKHLHGYR